MVTGSLRRLQPSPVHTYIRMNILYVAAQYPTEFVFTLVVYVFVLILAGFTVYFVDFSFFWILHYTYFFGCWPLYHTYISVCV